MLDTRTIEDVTETLIDYRGKTPEKTKSGVVLITAKVIKDGRILDENHEYISNENYDSWMRRGLPKLKDILITTEAPLGEVAQLKRTEKIALAQRVILLRANPKIINQDFYFHALRSPFVKGELSKRATGTTVLGIKQSELRKVRIPYFPLPAQRRIAFILSAYDDLVENNTRRIQILEEMARRIYEEWFVQFRFPGHENVRMVESEFGLIPSGWNANRLGDIAQETRRTVDPSEIEPSTPYVGLEHIPRRSIALMEWGQAKDVQSTKHIFKAGNILFGKIRPYFHKVCVAPLDGVCSSDAIVIEAKEKRFFSFVLGTVSSDAFVQHATQTSNGVKMPRANWSVLIEYPVFIPTNGLSKRFADFVEPTLAQIKNLTFKVQTLRKTRDLLLPKLISGEIDVSDFPEPETV